MRILHRILSGILLGAALWCLFAVPAAASAASSWSNEDSLTLSQACDWLESEPAEPITFFCLGTAGKSASPQVFTDYLDEVKTSDVSRNAMITSRQILSFTFSGYHAAQVDGMNLLERLYQCQEPRDTYQCVYSILALASNAYPEDPAGVFCGTALGEKLLSYQNEDGGFRMGAAQSASTVHHTAAAITALSTLPQSEARTDAMERGVAYLESVQQPDGEFLNEGEPSSILAAQVMIAEISLHGTAGFTEHFCPDGKLLPDVLMRYVQSDGGFAATATGDSSRTATEFAVVALAALRNGRNPYLMSTPLTVPAATGEPTKLESPKIQSRIQTLIQPSRDVSLPFFYGLYLLFFGSLITYFIVAKMDIAEYRKQETIRRCLKKLRKTSKK